MARVGQLFGLILIPTTVFGVDSTPRMGELTGGWVGWGNLGLCLLVDLPLSGWGYATAPSNWGYGLAPF